MKYHALFVSINGVYNTHTGYTDEIQCFAISFLSLFRVLIKLVFYTTRLLGTSCPVILPLKVFVNLGRFPLAKLTRRLSCCRKESFTIGTSNREFLFTSRQSSWKIIRSLRRIFKSSCLNAARCSGVI